MTASLFSYNGGVDREDCPPVANRKETAMTKEQKMMAWHYARVRKDAVDTLAEILGESVEDTKAGVCNALADVFRCKGSKDAARAVLAASAWCWGKHEETAMEAEVLDSEAEPAAEKAKTVAAAVK